MTIREGIHHTEQALSHAWPKPLSRLLARELLAGILEVSSAHLLSHPDNPLPQTFIEDLPTLERRLRLGEPIAHILGWKLFHGHRFRVTRHTLIPRHETETLVRLAGRAPKNSAFVDIGTGSGCVAISLQLAHPTACILATDISVRALRVAKANAETLAPASRIRFLHASLLEPKVRQAIQQLPATSIVITANLPYLPQSDKRALHTSVTQYEPDLALYANDHGNALIKTLLRQCKRLQRIIPGRALALHAEFDPPQAATLLAFAQDLFGTSTCAIVNDENALPRFLSVYPS